MQMSMLQCCLEKDWDDAINDDEITINDVENLEITENFGIVGIVGIVGIGQLNAAALLCLDIVAALTKSSLVNC